MTKDVEQNLEEYKKAIELKEKQLSNINFFLQGAKKSYDAVKSENTELKNRLKILNRDTNSNRNNNNQNILTGKENTLGKNKQKEIKTVVYGEESDSEPEEEESEYIPEETEEIQEPIKEKKTHKK